MEKYILDITDEDIFGSFDEKNAKPLVERVTVKAVIKKGNEFGFVTNDAIGVLMLAGGGADTQDLEQEIKREVLEETSWKSEVLKKLYIDRSKRKKEGREVITHSFLVEVSEKMNGDFRKSDEKNVNMQVVFLDAKVALYRMELQKKSVEAMVYKKHYNTNFNLLRDYEIFKKFSEENML